MLKLLILLFCETGPLAGLMTDKFGHRTTIIVGCVGTGASLAVASLTSSFEVVFVAYGVLAGNHSTVILLQGIKGVFKSRKM